jgi:RNA methyltransferase, TrmH family
MLSRNQVKHVNSLKLKKNREQQQQFIAEGSKLVLDLLESGFFVCDIFATMEWIRIHRSVCLAKKILPVPVTDDELSRITALTTPGPVLAVFSIPDRPVDAQSIPGKLILVLDTIRDPGNLGTIIRIADWFGIDEVICSETTVDLYNPKVVQATMGSIARVPVFYTGLEKFLSELPESLSIYGSFLDGQNIYDEEIDGRGIIIIGNESTGISDNVAKFVTRKLYIPSFPNSKGSEGNAESLNVSVATAILCSEFKRRTVMK